MSKALVRNYTRDENSRIVPNPSDFIVTFTEDFAGAQTTQAILTPATGEKLEIHGVCVSTNVNNVDITLEFATSSKDIFKLYTSQQQSAATFDMHIDGAVDEAVTLTCGAGTFVLINYHSERATED